MAASDPITSKQIDYIEALIKKRGSNVQCVLGEMWANPPLHLADLDRGEASELIDYLKEPPEPKQTYINNTIIDDDDVPF